MDELLEYAKTSGGSEYLSNLGVALKSNPIPVALMGVSLAWLIANPASPRRATGREMTMRMITRLHPYGLRPESGSGGGELRRALQSLHG